MGVLMETLKRRGDAVDRSGTCIPPQQATDIMKVNNNVAQPVSMDANGTVAHDPLSLGSRTPAMDGLDMLLESAFDAAVRTQVESAGYKYTPPERSTVVDPELKAAADRLVAAAPLLNKAVELAATRETRMRKLRSKRSNTGSASGSASGEASVDSDDGDGSGSIAAARRGALTK